MAEYKEGIENVPIIRDLPILVIIHDLKKKEVIEEKRLNYNDHEDRKRLGRLTFWAITNHCTVETIAMVDAEAETENGK